LTLDVILRVFHVTLQVGNLKRSVQFYTRVLGMTVVSFEEVPEESISVAFLRHAVEEFFQIKVYDPAAPLLDVFLRLRHCLMGRSPWSEPVAVFAECGVPSLLQYLQHRYSRAIAASPGRERKVSRTSHRDDSFGRT
jgi:hypothetical protein